MATSREQAKKEIKKLIEKYERVKKAKQLRRYDEADTRRVFIEPFFQALGWDVYNEFTDREVVEEEVAVKGKVDYSFRLNNIPQFLLEAKSLKVDLDKVEWAKQAVTYGWNKGIPWVVLTDFKGLKLFNSEWLVDTPKPNLEFAYDKFLTRLDDLWFLSRESIEKGELDKQAEKWGIKAKRLKVSEKLAADLLEWRELLRKYFKRYNPEVDESDVDEAVQRVLDRFIFIRTCEDRKLEPQILWPALRKWITHNRKPDNFMQALKPIFKDFDRKYNSNLFLEHLCEKLDTEGTPFEQIINDLYADKERGVKYNFAAIDADVLGSIYEQYLGFVQGKGLVNGAKRKKQGIYYTPAHIVDYIVQNTLGVALKEKSLKEIENIKILDPACGSGSFLIKAFALLDEKLAEEKAQEKSGPHAAFRKYNILKNNIYGVDLDSQAIEIARLNLLLKALEPNHKLPLLSDNTKVGNSLISGTEKKLKKYFGKNWQEKKPFNWKEEFPEVFKQEGFDVIIGNPPYGASFTQEDKSYLSNVYPMVPDYESYIYFISRGLSLLKQGGCLSYIIPNTFLSTFYGKGFREKLLKNFKIISIIDLTEDQTFKDASVRNCIVIAKKDRFESGKNVTFFKYDRTKQLFELFNAFGKEVLEKELDNWLALFDYSAEKDRILKKIESVGARVSDYFEVSQGLIPYDKYRGHDEYTIKNRIWHADHKKDATYKKELKGGDVKRYSIKWNGKSWISYGNWLAAPREPKFFREERVLVREITGVNLICSWTKEEYYNTPSIINVIKKKNSNYSLKVLLGIVNSTLMGWYNLNKSPKAKKGLFPKILVNDVRNLPLPKYNTKNKSLFKLVNRMIKINEELLKTTQNSDKWTRLRSEIAKLQDETDQLIYKLYNLTPEETELVEGKSKK